MSERELTIDDKVWGFSVGSNGIGIMNPIDGKRYNVSLHDFFVTVTLGPTYLSEHSVRPVTPAMVREYVEVQFLKVRSLPDFRMFYRDYGVCHVYAHKSIPYDEVLRRVASECYWVTKAMEENDPRIWGGENPNPARHAPTTHLMYFFEYTYELSKNYRYDVTAADNVVLRKTDNAESQETN